MSSTSQHRESVTILVAEDDEDDRELAREALQSSRLVKQLRFVSDGQDLLDYLRREGRHTGSPAAVPRPGLVLLDLNMPRKDGREALAEIKSDASLRHIPVVVLTTSKAEEDIASSYDLGANSYITKPTTMPGLVDAMHALVRYWLDLVELPERVSAG